MRYCIGLPLECARDEEVWIPAIHGCPDLLPGASTVAAQDEHNALGVTYGVRVRRWTNATKRGYVDQQAAQLESRDSHIGF